MLLRSFFARYRLLAFFCPAAILIAIAGQAEANITYTLNPIAGNDGTTLTGVITTDGATGPLATTDILGATFESPGNIADGFTTFTGAAQLSQISATNSGLLFDGFSSSLLFNNAPTAGDPFGRVDLLAPPAQTSWEGFLTIEGTFPPTTGEIQFTSQGYFATATTPAPEPATITLLGMALLGIGMVSMRRRGARKVGAHI